MGRINNLFFKAFQFFVFTATTKIIEMLFCLNYTWYAFCAIIPKEYVYSGLFDYLDNAITRVGTVSIFLILAYISTYALVKNIVVLRKVVLVFSMSLCFLTAALSLFGRYPPAAGAGFTLILGMLTCTSLWKMTINDKNKQ